MWFECNETEKKIPALPTALTIAVGKAVVFLPTAEVCRQPWQWLCRQPWLSANRTPTEPLFLSAKSCLPTGFLPTAVCRQEYGNPVGKLFADSKSGFADSFQLSANPRIPVVKVVVLGQC